MSSSEYLEPSGTASENVAVAKFACDSCRQRKLRCTRELPKCTNCKPWPGPCVYSHMATSRKKQATSRSACNSVSSAPSASTSSSTEDRLGRIETTIGTLADAVQTLTRLLEPKLDQPPNTTTSTFHSNSTVELPTQDAFSPLPQASRILDSVSSRIPPEVLDGSASLQDLSQALLAVHFEGDKVREDARWARKANELFIIPEQEEGQVLIKEFMNILERSQPLFLMPSNDLARKIVFEPSNVPRGWVLLFYCLTATASALQTPEYATTKKSLRWNTWIAIDNGGLFMEPSEINMQALFTLAIHGDSFATPSMSWTLVSHACRMAQALNLHLPTQEPRKILMFWALYAVDKGVSLAFGRPPMLPSSYYQNVLLPDLDGLSEYTPHVDRQEGRGHAQARSFGATHFLQSILLSILSGKILHFLNLKGSVNQASYESEKDALQGELEQWYQTTMPKLRAARDSEISTEMDESQLKEMTIGLNSLTFQFYHLKVLLTRQEEMNPDTCLDAARNALHILPLLVSTSEQVYNGIIWQLLYYPFNPFFVLFGNIIHAPLSEHIRQDVQLLRSTVSYYNEMSTTDFSLAKKLGDVAHVFASLAELYTHNTMIRNTSGETAGSCDIGGYSGSGSAPAIMTSMPGTSFGMESDGGATSNLDFDFSRGSDLLNYFTNLDYTMQLDFNGPQSFVTSEDGSNMSAPGPALDMAQHLESNVFESFDKWSVGSKRPLECTFDWFTWDLNQ
ncbi:hypothetical protein BT63DRAFT_451449 [Microthyrium microscopicum]|uniref:Zn(2)-C6 fungal-type domain-containing protein n=1 Tax=Microthyrium microscopicum TaxID=703497 RepID=A0A6A6UNW4_9PEZI|nr:hypothetical protein BT63DRAFT_451449 [Microthyrium microscopicum]